MRHHGRLAQSGQSTSLTPRVSGVRVPHRPPLHERDADRRSREFGDSLVPTASSEHDARARCPISDQGPDSATTSDGTTPAAVGGLILIVLGLGMIGLVFYLPSTAPDPDSAGMGTFFLLPLIPLAIPPIVSGARAVTGRSSSALVPLFYASATMLLGLVLIGVDRRPFAIVATGFAIAAVLLVIGRRRV